MPGCLAAPRITERATLSGRPYRSASAIGSDVRLEPEADAQRVDELPVGERRRPAVLVEEKLVFGGKEDERGGVHVVLDAGLGAGFECVVYAMAIDVPDFAADERLPLPLVAQREVEIRTDPSGRAPEVAADVVVRHRLAKRELQVVAEVVAELAVGGEGEAVEVRPVRPASTQTQFPRPASLGRR